MVGAHGWNDSLWGMLNSDEKLYAAIPVYAATNEFIPPAVAIILGGEKGQCGFEALLLNSQAKIHSSPIFVSCGVTKCARCFQSSVNFTHCHVMPNSERKYECFPESKSRERPVFDKM